MGSWSFAPDDSVVGFTIYESGDNGASKLLAFRPDWTTPTPTAQKTETVIPDSKNDRAQIAVGAFDGSGYRIAYVSDSNKNLVSQIIARPASGNLTASGASSPVTLFSRHDLNDIRFVGAQNKLVGITSDGHLIVWDTNTDGRRTELHNEPFQSLRSSACTLAGRPLTGDEKAQYIGPDYQLLPCGGNDSKK